MKRSIPQIFTFLLGIIFPMYGQFLPPAPLPAGNTYRGFRHTIHDLDGDGRKDVVRNSTGKMNWLKNLGNGFFGSNQEIQLPFNPKEFVVYAHLDNDSLEDIVWADGKLLRWSKNLGNLMYGAPQVLVSLPGSITIPHPTAGFSGGIGIGDINLDQKPDFFGNCGWFVGGDVLMRFFYRALSNPSGSYSFQIDSSFSNPIVYNNTQCYSINASGTQGALSDGYLFTLPSSGSLFQNIPIPVFPGINLDHKVLAMGNLVGDSLPDLVIEACNYSAGIIKLGVAENINGHFATVQQFAFVNSPNYCSWESQIADIDGDGLNDFISNINKHGIAWYRNLGNGLFSGRKVIIDHPTSEYVLGLGDFSGDHKTDLLTIANYPYGLFLYPSGLDTLAHLTGRIYFDPNSNCTLDEPYLTPVSQIVKIEPGNHLVATNSANKYSVYLPQGTYQAKVLNAPGSFLVDSTCFSGGPTIEIDSLLTDKTKDIGWQGTACPYVIVDAVIGSLVPCRTSREVVFVSNKGAQTATNVEVRVKLPFYSHFKSYTSSPWSSHIIENTSGWHVFNFESIYPQGTAVIEIEDSTSCLQNLGGQSQCLEARVSYQGGCLPTANGWDGSNLLPELVCLTANQTKVVITNTGQNMADSSSFRIVSGNQSLYQRKIKISQNETAVYSAHVAGSGLQVIVEQTPFHPIGPYYSAVAASCPGGVNATSRLFFSGNQPDHAISCSQIRTSHDPNDKTVFPMGWGSEGNVFSKTPLLYKIRFQNKGTIHAEYVQVRDTLSPHLDLSTLRFVGSSPKEALVYFSVEGSLESPVLVYTYPTIYLPDSLANPIQSQGFVAFTIQPKTGLAQGTQIKNRASILFDNNPAVLTNWTLTTINDSIPNSIQLVLANGKTTAIEKSLHVFPNPSRDWLWIETEGIGIGIIRVFDSKGLPVFERQVNETNPKSIQLSLAPGFYIVRFEGAGGRVQSQKLVVN